VKATEGPARVAGEAAGTGAGDGRGNTDPAGAAPGARPVGASLRMELGASYRARKQDFLGIGLSCLHDSEFIDAVREAVQTRSRLAVSFINPDYVLRGHHTGIVEKMNRFDIVLPDGWGIVYGARMLGIPMPNRQGNGDICPQIFALSAEHGFSNFMFGCGEGVAEQAADKATGTFPGLPIAGTLHGHWDVVRGHPGRYTEADIDMMVDVINASNADIIHVSLPTPIQQNWVWQVADRINVPVIVTGGSYLDHLSERVYWYPKWMHTMRLCWLYRLSREPRRLWKRYSLDLVAYGAMVLRAKLTPRRRSGRPA
jgi:N-acetylglucosaminyldiphosphoundecaprenol N-acetyl-beta-D-mannosaminyltransferase